MTEVSFGDMPGDKQERMRCLLGEFDLEVESRAEKMKMSLQALKAKIQKEFALEMIKIPKTIRGMTIKEFTSQYGGDIQAVSAAQIEKAVTTFNTTSQMMVDETPVTATKGGKKRKPLGQTTNVDAELTTPFKQEAPATVTRTSQRTVIKKARTTAEEDTENADDFKTPSLRGRTAAKTVQATPAFDPRLPKTPFLRQIKRGESILSMNGSPLAVDTSAVRVAASSDPVIMVPLANGKALELSNGVDASALSNRARKEAVDKLQRLQDQVAGLLAQLNK